jgi:hypothetical protein
VELDEIGAAKGRSVLVLLAAGQAQVNPLDLEGDAGDVIVLLRQFLSNTLKSRGFLTHYAFP